MNLNTILAPWEAIYAALELGPIVDQAHYQRNLAQLDQLTDIAASRDDHPLWDLIALIGEHVANWEALHDPAPIVTPAAILDFLMQQHQLKQSDLPEVGSQGVISELLSGQRQPNVRQIQALCARFQINPASLILSPAPRH